MNQCTEGTAVTLFLASSAIVDLIFLILLIRDHVQYDARE